jgi:hypothetical protein
MDADDVNASFRVNTYELPPFALAQRLVVCYMNKVHSSFPFLAREVFKNQSRENYRRSQDAAAPRLSDRWLANLNLVFAIDAKHAHLINRSWRGDTQDLLVYQN